MAKQKSANKVKMIDTMGVKINIFFEIALLVVIIALISISIPRVQRNIKSLTQEYMLDMADIHGRLLENNVAAMGNMSGVDKAALLKDVKLADVQSSYAYLVDKDSIMLYHPTESKIGEPVENSVVKGLISQMNGGTRPESDCVAYEYKGAIKYASYYVAQDLSFILVITADESDVFADLNKTVGVMIAVSVFTFLLLVVFSNLMIPYMMRGLRTLSDIVDKAADLDLTDDERIDTLVARKDEIGAISKSVDNLRKQLRDVIASVSEQSNILNETSVTFQQRFEDIAENVNNVNFAIEEIAMGSTSQAQETTSAGAQVSDLGDTVEANNASVSVLDTAVSGMTEHTDKADADLKELVRICDETSESIRMVVEQTQKTNESVNKIKVAVALIQDIAQQTNLLSLNASIEAARAGESGRGFAVVAEEIRKLSEGSNANADEIGTIVRELIENSDITVQKMNEVAQNTSVQLTRLAETRASFDGLKSETQAVADASHSITEQTKQLDIIKNSVNDSVSQLASISQENAASTEETSASMQTLTIAVDDCKTQTEALAELSNELKAQTDKFKL